MSIHSISTHSSISSHSTVSRDDIVNNTSNNNNNNNNNNLLTPPLNDDDFAPQAYDPEDAQSQLSGNLSSTLSRAESLKMVRTETAKSLKNLGLNKVISIADPIRPSNINNPIFPEEYTLETSTGLVPVETLHEIGRSRSKAQSGTTSSFNRFPTNYNQDNEDDEDIQLEKEKEKEQQKNQDLDEESQSSKINPPFDPEIQFVTFYINDPENPHNWKPFLRWTYTIILSLMVVCVAFGSSIVTGALGPMSEKYHVSTEVSILSCSLMVLGFSVGPLIWSPLSEQIGRRPVYFISFGLYFIFNIPCAVAPNIGTILVCRFLCGVFAASGLANVGGSISDMFPTETRGKAIAYFAAAPYGGPVIGPLVGGFITRYNGRISLIFWVNFAFSGLMWIVGSLIPETYAPVILKRRAKKLRNETGNEKIMTEQEAAGLSLKELIETCLYRPLKFAITEPVLDLMCFYVCLIYSLLYAFFFAYPVVFGELYNFGDDLVGLVLIPIIIGAGLALLTTPIIESYYVKMCQTRNPTPEDRLIGAMIGSPFPAIALWILGSTSEKHIFWVGPASSGLAFGYGMVLIYYSLNNYIIDTYAKYAASALATKVFLRSAGGAAFPLFTMQMYHKLGLRWASYLLAFITTAMIILPFAFYKWGKSLRKRFCKENFSAFPDDDDE
ncbi:spermine transporter [Pichia kluyveri]|uniref:Spermine transporter n=1 Tax=Pichia kluyveri TaxID=36015 RepID=A0AAV5R6B4_PICKL|nr:spermine transporter [Pichia kluyveri]